MYGHTPTGTVLPLTATTRYQPDYTRRLLEEIRTLIEENSREELQNELAAIPEELEEWQATYDVEMWEALEQSLAGGDLASAELRDRRDVIVLWRENAPNVRGRRATSGLAGRNCWRPSYGRR